MTKLLEDMPSHPIPRPPSIVQKKICSVSGLIPPPDGSPNQCETRFEYFIKGTEPIKVDPGMQKAFIDKTTQDLAKPGQTDNIEEKDAWIVKDATGDSYCITCPHPEPSPTP